MNYITKKMAENVAIEMLRGIEATVKNKQNVLSQAVESLYKRKIDNTVLENLSRVPDEYLTKSSYLELIAPTGKRKSVHLNTRVIIPVHNYKVELTMEEFEEVVAYQMHIDSTKDKAKTIKEELVATILKLRTVEKLEKQFPEAYSKLPKDSFSKATAVAKPVENILDEIKMLSEA